METIGLPEIHKIPYVTSPLDSCRGGRRRIKHVPKIRKPHGPNNAENSQKE
jgi:hypothetical protein